MKTILILLVCALGYTYYVYNPTPKKNTPNWPMKHIEVKKLSDTPEYEIIKSMPYFKGLDLENFLALPSTEVQIENSKGIDIKHFYNKYGLPYDELPKGTHWRWAVDRNVKINQSIWYREIY